ncbi:MAG TPA: histidine phosphatase family protein [Eoetvoesiella sp.]
MSTTQFWLIRHGETQWNIEKRLQGWLDIPLNDRGVGQAERLGDYLRSPLFDVQVDVVVSSDLSRALDTARIAAGHFGKPVEACAQLRERSFGIYEGWDWAALNGESSGQAGLNFRDPHQLIERGETLHDFGIRIGKAFEDLAQRYKGQNIVAFAHGGVIDVAWRKASRLSFQAPRLDLILNTSINHFAIDEDHNWNIINWGQAEHLDIAALDDII